MNKNKKSSFILIILATFNLCMASKKPEPKSNAKLTAMGKEEFAEILATMRALTPVASQQISSQPPAPKKPLPRTPRKKPKSSLFLQGAQIIAEEPEDDPSNAFCLTIEGKLTINLGEQKKYVQTILLNTYDKGWWSITEDVDIALLAEPLNYLTIPIKDTSETLSLDLRKYPTPGKYRLFKFDNALFIGKTKRDVVYEIDFDSSLIVCD